MRTSIRSLAPAAAAFALAACGGAAPAVSPATSQPAAAPAAASGLTKLPVSYTALTSNVLPVWVAQESGLFRKNGLDVELSLITGPDAMAAMLAGQTAVAQTGGSEAISAAGNGADPVVLAVIAPTYPFVFEAAPSIKSFADLKGKKVGVSKPGASDYIATRTVLKKFGLDPAKDVTILSVGISPERVTALLNGAIQASVIDLSLVPKVEAEGAHPLYDLVHEKVPAVSAVIDVKRSWLATHRDTAQHYVDAIVQAIALERRDKAMTVGVLKKYLKSDDDKTMEAVYKDHLETVPAIPTPRAEQFADTLESLQELDPKLAGFDLKSIVDASLVQSAADRHLDQS